MTKWVDFLADCNHSLSSHADIHISAHPNAEKALKGLVGDETSGLDFFSLPIELGPDGVKDVHSLGQISDSEKELLKACVAELKGNIEKVRYTTRSSRFECVRAEQELIIFVPPLPYVLHIQGSAFVTSKA